MSMISWYDGAIQWKGWYVLNYLKALVQDSAPEKLGIAALVAVVSAGYESLDVLFWAVGIFWAADMVTGTLRAWRSPKEQIEWARAVDGLARFFVIFIGAVVARICELVSVILFSFDPGGVLVVAVLTVFGVQELLSVTRNMEYFYPRISKFRGMIIKFRDGGVEIAKGRIIVEEDKGENE